MRISSVHIENFRNFKSLTVDIGQNLILVGENQAGKSNFIYALRLILDPSLSDLDRQLMDHDFWDGEEPYKGREIRVELTVTDYADEEDPDYLPLSLFDGYSIVETQPKKIAKLTYLFYNAKQLDEPQKSGPDDYEFKVFTGNDQNNQGTIKEIRKNIPLQVINALRDIASDNRIWRRSPLSKLVELTNLEAAQLEPFAEEVKTISNKVLDLQPLSTLQAEIKTRMENMVGSLYSIDPELGLNATTPRAIQEDLRLFTEGEKRRSLERTSLGMQNALYLALLSLLTEKQQIKRTQKEERYLPIVALEEPEAHLHPHLQRLVFEDFLRNARERKQPVIISTHSPHIVSASRIDDLILFKNGREKGCIGTSAYSFMQKLPPRDQKDLERFLDLTKSEMLFSKGVIFIEGDVEQLLINVFAEILGRSLDQFGISVCNVNGTHFENVVTLAHNFSIPFIIFTDGDDKRDYTGVDRGLKFLSIIDATLADDLRKKYFAAEKEKIKLELKKHGIFVNYWTFEVALLESGYYEELKNVFDVLGTELGEKVRAGKKHVDEYRTTRSDEAIEKVLSSIEDSRWGKGRFAQRLIQQIVDKANTLKAKEEKEKYVPEYIRQGIEHIISLVQSNKRY